MAAASVARSARGPIGSVASRVRRVAAVLSPLELFAFMILATILLLTVLGPLIAPYPVETANPAERLQPPSFSHWLGTDENGMDIFSRILASPRTDVSIAVIATLLSVVIGSPLGVLAGYFEGARRRIASLLSEGLLRLLDVIQAFPVFILAMVLVAIRGTSLTNIIAAIAFVNLPVFLRLVRSEILSLRERPYAEAARAIGNSDIRIGFRHLLPNALPPILVQISVTIGFAILLTAGLSFVGAGISPPTPELGAMIATGAKFMIIGQWWPSLFPGIALGLMVFAFAVAGEALGRVLQPGAVHGRPGEIPAGTVPMTGVALPPTTTGTPPDQFDPAHTGEPEEPILDEPQHRVAPDQRPQP